MCRPHQCDDLELCVRCQCLIFWVPPILGNYSILKLFPTQGSNERSVLDMF